MTSPPAWFSAALDAAVQEGTTTVDGVSISYRTWGDPAGRSIVLVHGGAAHSRWWDHIAPMLTDGWRVVAIDLSGHGDSDRREQYSLDTWAREVLAVAAEAGTTTEAGSTAASVVIGHSMGGLVTLRLATLAGSQIAGAVAIDSPVRDMAPEDRAARQHRAFGPLRVYPTRRRPAARWP
jgi:pimeloyl-ACP methyl ester carboxylesterase